MFLGVTVALLLAFEVLALLEQSQSPGEKDLGVGVLGMIFLIPALILGISGVGCLVVGVSAWIWQSLLRRRSEEHRES